MKKQKSGFTLVELVVVVMILGILAAVAAPKLLDTSSAATENGAKQTLAVVRDAIERFAAENGGALPGSSDDLEGTFKNDLKAYLRGPFPTCPVGALDDAVAMTTVSTALTPDNTTGWMYSTTTGEFIINSTDQDSQGKAYNTY